MGMNDINVCFHLANFCHSVGVAVFPSHCIEVIRFFAVAFEPQVLLRSFYVLSQRTIVYFTLLVLEMFQAVHVTALMEKKCSCSREVLFQSVNMNA